MDSLFSFIKSALNESSDRKLTNLFKRDNYKEDENFGRRKEQSGDEVQPVKRDVDSSAADDEDDENEIYSRFLQKDNQFYTSTDNKENSLSLPDDESFEEPGDKDY